MLRVIFGESGKGVKGKFLKRGFFLFLSSSLFVFGLQLLSPPFDLISRRLRLLVSSASSCFSCLFFLFPLDFLLWHCFSLLLCLFCTVVLSVL